MCETWLKPSNNQDIAISGFNVFIHSRTTLHKRAKRGSEGLAIFIKEDLKNYIDILTPRENQERVWLRCHGNLFSQYISVFICFGYIPLESSCNVKAYNETVWSDVELEILHYSKMGKVMICGDLNGHTGSISQDKVVNNQGKHLIDLCYTADLYILNVTFGDITSGNLTFYGHQRGSVVDYILSSKQIVFTSFNVSPLSQFSDHCSISFNLQTKQNISSFLLICQYAEELALDLLSREEESGINVRYKWIEVKKRDLISLITSAEWTSMFSRYTEHAIAN